MNHTKGNWSYSKTINDFVVYSDESSAGKDIALVYKDSRAVHFSEAEANAKLFTASKDLLEAAQAMIDAPGTGEPNGNTPRSKALRQMAYDKLYAAIQKATLILCLSFLLSACSRNCVGHHPHTGQKFTKHSSGNAYRMMR